VMYNHVNDGAELDIEIKSWGCSVWPSQVVTSGVLFRWSPNPATPSFTSGRFFPLQNWNMGSRSLTKFSKTPLLASHQYAGRLAPAARWNKSSTSLPAWPRNI